MPKKISEKEKKQMIDSFIEGQSIDALSEIYNCTKSTVTRHLKKGVNEKFFKELAKKNKSESKIKDKIRVDHSSNKFKESLASDSPLFLDSPFIEIAPLDLEIDNEPQKDLASISITDIELPKIVFMIVNNKIELETKYLQDYPEWQFLSQDELNRITIEIFFDIKNAKRNCKKEQKVIKVPNTNVFRIVAPLLVSRGISRIVCPEKLISL